MEDTMELDLREVLEIILKRIWIIVAIALVATITSGVVSLFLLDKIYETSTTLIVNKPRNDRQASPGIEYNELMVNQKLVKTYSVIVKSDIVLQRVISDLKLQMNIDQLRDMITVKSEAETEIIRITVQDKVPQEAQSIANSLATVFQSEVKRILLMENVQVIDQAKLPMTPVKPRPMMNIALAALIGIMAGLGIVLLIEYLDNTIKTPDDVQKGLELPVLGAIPSFEE